MRNIPRCFLLAFMVVLMLATPAPSAAQVAVGITVAFAPPDLPVYEQPICPGEGFIWTPGYWAWDPDFDDYYWVPGTWVLAPEVGFFWTPGYWAWGGSGFIFYEGFWGPVVGFYGGINYGFGYFGQGYVGGRWDGGQFFYNRSVNNVNVTVIHNVYNTTVINNTNVTRVSYNGGNGGINARPTPQEEAAAHARHLPPVPEQRQHVQAARSDPQLRASVNRGKPPIAATPKPGAFKEHGVVHAREAGAIHNAPRENKANAPRENKANSVPRPTTAVHPNELPRAERPSPRNTGNPKLDKKYQQQQEKLYAQQDKERQKLQQQQEKEHQQLARQHADEARRQQVEQRHQQQTEQLQQKHSQQQQRLQERQPEERSAPPREKEKH
jgi:YXWGXW repeat-containing protein